MPRWEYRVERYHPPDVQGGGATAGSGIMKCVDMMNALGAEGWDLISIIGDVPYDLAFKREIVPDSEEEKE